MTPFTYFLIVTSFYEVFIEGMEYADTFHTFSHCDFIVWSIHWGYSMPSINTSYNEVRMRKGMKNVIILHPLNNYFMQWGHNEKKCERCHRTPFPQWILHTMKSQWEKVWKVSATSLYEVFIEGIGYDDTFNTFSHFDLTVWSINWGDGVRWHYNEVTMRKGVEGVSVLHSFNKNFIKWGHN
jgi:hypothetical protein